VSGATYPPAEYLVRLIRDMDARLARLERMPSGANSIGIGQLRPAVKAGVPSDADYTTPPPVGSVVIDTTNLRIYVRVGVANWDFAQLT
jgi:hypothetical protein